MRGADGSTRLPDLGQLGRRGDGRGAIFPKMHGIALDLNSHRQYLPASRRQPRCPARGMAPCVWRLVASVLFALSRRLINS